MRHGRPEKTLFGDPVFILACLGLGISGCIIQKGYKERAEELSHPSFQKVELNNDNRKDVLVSTQSSNFAYIALINGQYDKCNINGDVFISTDNMRTYTKNGLLIDRENSTLVDLVSGKKVILK